MRSAWGRPRRKRQPATSSRSLGRRMGRKRSKACAHTRPRGSGDTHQRQVHPVVSSTVLPPRHYHTKRKKSILASTGKEMPKSWETNHSQGKEKLLLKRHFEVQNHGSLTWGGKHSELVML
ncbi:hypothetical protein, unlikely [Trypanosoma brucei gambiense DAL972]|uniref:Uncharacterized protein n=1 Tax=Trypanosoma brucei gambiense (strain MHOM/CI/86/DAL972) TaxID=679716 RepID=C9ZU52_TRYB9|nr:hypothetical protein, unlikely [Trypanosoma brucei gambiense DAL972]CBH12938.1 hypothetical protein, unlikely [Trypanosoma brucei gambiense DAL972]|eukprot:XP_011775217.1 hypothetical protein, unlikely [Trypanosoma brucei gambiense DAL972]